MKKRLFICTALLTGASYEALAAAGKTTDGLVFIAFIVGFLLLILGFLSGVDYLKKNGKRFFRKAKSSLIKVNTLLKDHLHKIRSEYFDLAYF